MYSTSQNVAINKNGQPADSSAMLDITDAYKGLLIPRLSNQQRDSIQKPATALFIFNSSLNRFQVNLGTPSQPVWTSIVTIGDLPAGSAAGWQLGGNTAIPDTSFIGTRDKRSLQLKTNGMMRMYVDSVSGNIGIDTMQPRTSVDIQATDAIIVPVGTTAQRPSSPVVGMIRFNSAIGKLEGYTTQGWVALH